MIGAVIGGGPRTGTSFVMQKLEEAGVPIHCDDEYYGGYYETAPENLAGLDKVVAKVWPSPEFPTTIHKAVVLLRAQKPQLQSIRKQMKAEGITEYEPRAIREACLANLQEMYPKIPEVLIVRTDQLDDRIDEIVEFFKEVVTWQ